MRPRQKPQLSSPPRNPKSLRRLSVTLPGPDWRNISPLDEAQRMNGERQERVDKWALALSEPRRIRNSGHVAFVTARAYLICRRNRAHAHHLKFAQPKALRRKVSDDFTVPLCSTHHRALHQHGDKRVWWAAHKIDALKVAEELRKTTSPNLVRTARSMEISEMTGRPIAPDQTRPS